MSLQNGSKEEKSDDILQTRKAYLIQFTSILTGKFLFFIYVG